MFNSTTFTQTKDFCKYKKNLFLVLFFGEGVKPLKAMFCSDLFPNHDDISYLADNFCRVFEEFVEIDNYWEKHNWQTNSERFPIGRLHVGPEDAVESLHGDGEDGGAGAGEGDLSQGQQPGN